MTDPWAQQPTFAVNNQSFTLRKLSLTDIVPVLDVERRSHPTPWKQEHFESSLCNHECVGLWSDTSLVGYGVISYVVGEAELLLFVLDIPFQGKGIAKRFLMKLLAQIQCHAKQIYLEVRESNLGAIGLYESVGFNQVGVRPRYYPPLSGSGAREDALLYAMELFPADV